MKRFFKKLNNFVVDYNNESKSLIYFLRLAGINNSHQVLDVGCGYGRILSFLTEHCYDVAGVDNNKHIVQVNKKAGLDCQNLDEFRERKKKI